MISSKIFSYFTRELLIFYDYKQFMNKIIFEHRSGALLSCPFFLSVGAPVLCSKYDKEKNDW